MAFANATIKTTGNNTVNTSVNKPAEPSLVKAEAGKTPKKVTLSTASKPRAKGRFSLKNVHRYKLVLSAIIGCVAAFTLFNMHNSRYSYDFKEYYAVSDLKSVDLIAIALKRELTADDKKKLAMQYEQNLLDVDVQTVRQELADLNGINYEQWSEVVVKLNSRTDIIKANKTKEFIKVNRLSALHIEQITAMRTSEEFVSPVPNAQQTEALKGVTMFKAGNRAAISTAYVHFKVASELNYWPAKQIIVELERLLPPEQIAELQYKLKEALLAAGIVPEVNEEELKASATNEEEETKEPEELTEEEKEAAKQEELKAAEAAAVAKKAEETQRNVQRELDVNTLLNAIHQRIIDNNYVIPTSLEGLESGKELCSTAFALCNGAKAIVEELLRDTFIQAIPVDPLANDKNYSGYKITINNQTLTVTALKYENGKFSKGVTLQEPVEASVSQSQESSESSASSYFRVNKRAIRENFEWYQKRFD